MVRPTAIERPTAGPGRGAVDTTYTSPSTRVTHRRAPRTVNVRAAGPAEEATSCAEDGPGRPAGLAAEAPLGSPARAAAPRTSAADSTPPPPAFVTCPATGSGTLCRATLTPPCALPTEVSGGLGARRFCIDERGTTD